MQERPSCAVFLQKIEILLISGTSVTSESEEQAEDCLTSISVYWMMLEMDKEAVNNSKQLYHVMSYHSDRIKKTPSS